MILDRTTTAQFCRLFDPQTAPASLRRRRKQYRIPSRVVAFIAGYDDSAIRAWERGWRIPTPFNLLAWAGALQECVATVRAGARAA